MANYDQKSGIFYGTDAIIASFFDLGNDQHLKHRSVSRNLGNLGGVLLTLVSSLYDRIESNHTGRIPSRENWRSKWVTTLSDHNKRPEVILERAVAMLGKSGCQRRSIRDDQGLTSNHCRLSLMSALARMMSFRSV
jgi:hypothetical protein